MAITPVVGDLEATRGSLETIQLTPCGPGTVNRIVSVIYGASAAGPTSITPISGDTFRVTVLPGMNLLQVVLNSTVAAAQTVMAQQPATGGGSPTILDDGIDIIGGLGVWSPWINGK